MANAAESGSLDVGEPVTAAVLQACTDINEMRDALMRALGKADVAAGNNLEDETVIPAFLHVARRSEGKPSPSDRTSEG